MENTMDLITNTTGAVVRAPKIPLTAYTPTAIVPRLGQSTMIVLGHDRHHLPSKFGPIFYLIEHKDPHDISKRTYA